MKTVLIIDDEPELLKSLASFIEGRGFRVFTASTGEEGLRLYREHRPECAFLDLHLPTLDGMSVLKRIKDIDPRAHVYIVTGDDDLILRGQGELLGSRGYLVKPVAVGKVVEILKNL